MQAAADTSGEDLRTDGPAAASLAARPSETKGPFPGPFSVYGSALALHLELESVDRGDPD